MKRIVFALLIISMIMSCFAALAEAPTLIVRGTGVVNLDADTATITLGVRVASADVATAEATVNDKISAIVGKLTEMGILMSDIHTNSMSIYPDYNYDDASNSIVGYTAENMISVKTTDIDQVGSFIDAAFEVGANTFYDINFSASDSTTENEQALELAIQHAFAKAQVMAAAVGMKLGDVQSISEEDYSFNENGSFYTKAAESDAGDGTQVYAAPLSVTASVVIEFALEADQQ